MTRRTRSEPDLIQASAVLRYDLWMLDALAKALDTSEPRPIPLENALLEAFAIHARALMEFFYADERGKQGPRPDDIIAEDYFPVPGHWTECCPKKHEVLEPVKRRVGKEIVHLTYGRKDLTEEIKGWRVQLICLALQEAAAVFRRAVPQQALCTELLTLELPRSDLADRIQLDATRTWITSTKH